MTEANTPQKPDAEHFRQHLQQVSQLDWGARQWWMKYLFHFADLVNAVSILKGQALYSRGGISRGKADWLDSASPDIIDQTKAELKDFVRFYFRPRTPTLYSNEGFRPKDRRMFGGAHCPIPIYLLFDFEALITREDSQFSYGSLARPDVPLYQTADAFTQFPFEWVYHDSRFAPEDKDRVIFHRHAEVVIPHKIDLQNLKQIWCRTPAEYETLYHLLPKPLRPLWRDKISIRRDVNLFNREWLHVERAQLSPAMLRFHLNPARNPMNRGPFDLRIKVVNTQTREHFTWHQPDAAPKSVLSVDLRPMGDVQAYTVRLYIDDHIAYAGQFSAEDAPF